MFTNNYIEFQKFRFSGAGAYGESIYLMNTDGASKRVYAHFIFASDIGIWLKKARCRTIVASYSDVTYPAETSLYPGVYFGSGSTPATKNDYTLESPITSGLTITNPTALAYVTDNNGKYEVCADYIVRNTTDANINIYEIGIFVPLSENNTKDVTSYTKLNLHLMERTVLTEPITIPAGESKLVTYKITFNQTLNVE